MSRLGSSDSAEAKDIRARLKSASADLARERDEARKEHVALLPSDLPPESIPSAEDAAPLYKQLAASFKLIKRGPTTIFDNGMNLSTAYTAAQMDLAKRQMARRAPLLQLIRRITDRKQLDFHHNWTVVTGGFAPELIDMRPAIWELRSESYLLARFGNIHQAITDMAGAFRFARHAGGDRLQIAYLVQVAMDGLAIRGMQDLIRVAQADPSVLDEIRTAITRNRPRYDLTHSLSAEPVMAERYLGQFRQQPEQSLYSPVGSGNPNAGNNPPKWSAEEKRFVANLFDAAEAEYLSRVRKILAAANLPYAERRDKLAGFVRPAFDLKMKTPISEPTPENPIEAIVHLLQGVSTETLEAGTQMDALANVTLAGIDVLIWKSHHGSYPEQLPASEPNDPFSGKPLKYRREPKGFVVYSVGPSGTFDGGKPGVNPETNEAFFRIPGDPPEPYVP